MLNRFKFPCNLRRCAQTRYLCPSSRSLRARPYHHYTRTLASNAKNVFLSNKNNLRQCNNPHRRLLFNTGCVFSIRQHSTEYNFEDMSLPSPAERLSAFREQLKALNIDCFIQSTNDAHQSEYVCTRDKRIAFLSCFTGSAGTLVVTQEKALLWTDGRYHLAAEKLFKQSSVGWEVMKQGLPETPSMSRWLKENAESIRKIGMDPFLTSIAGYNGLKDALDDEQQQIVLVDKNPIDVVWGKHQPPVPQNKVFVLDDKYSGQSIDKKMETIRSKLKEYKADALIVSSLDHIAWALNLRGNDISYNPVFFSYLIVTKNEALLFIDPSKLEAAKEEEKKSGDAPIDIKQHLKNVTIKKYEEFLPTLSSMVEANKTHKFWYDPRKCNMAIFNAIPKPQRFAKDDCIEIMKSVKNDTEIQGFINCHVRDGAAKTRFFAWIDQLRESGKDELEKQTEWSFAEKLLSFRREADLFVDLSFETISSIAGNGAIIHYSPSEEEHAQIKGNEVYLLDSGGQYFDGTTDTTRTTWLGVNGAQPSDHQRECYTRVLKGVIALTQMIFPENTKGPMIDSIARSYLWQIGLDYRHGTGHGVGHFLNVHEGPQGFSASTFRRTLYEYGLRPNMIITNEPGYYESDAFGIRIENVMIVVPAKTKHQFGGTKFCTFKTATMVPIDKQLLDVSIMNKQEIAWLDEYHQQVYKNILPFMKSEYEQTWLKKVTDPVVC